METELAGRQHDSHSPQHLNLSNYHTYDTVCRSSYCYFMYRVGQKSKLLILIEYVDKTEKIVRI